MEASTATDLLNPAYSPMIRIVWVTCCIYFYFIIFFWPCHAACRSLVPQLGTEPMPLALGVLITEPPGCPRYSFYRWRIQG